MILSILDYNSGGFYIYNNFPAKYKRYVEDYIQDVLKFNLDEIYYMLGSKITIENDLAEINDKWFKQIQYDNMGY